MGLLNNLPLIGSILGVLLGFFILFSKGVHANNRAAKITLGIIVLLNAHSLLDAYLFYNQYPNWPGLGFAYLHFHLIGALFLLYTYFLFKVEVNLKLWGSVLVVYTLLRLVVLLPADPEAYQNYSDDLSWQDFGLLIDYYLSQLLNIGLLILAYNKTKNLRFSVTLDKIEQLNYRWLQNLLLLSIVIFIAMVPSSILSLIDQDQWLMYWKIESVILSIFFFALAFCAIRFPVFAIHGDFTELAQHTGKKYAKSSLKSEASELLWAELNRIMQEEKPYRDPEYRLNDLATSTGKSLHHVSQVINEQRGISFSDYVNQFRVKEAQDLLKSERAKVVTILAIALEVGFNSKTAFYNAFKKVTGTTPTEFRKLNQP